MSTDFYFRDPLSPGLARAMHLFERHRYHTLAELTLNNFNPVRFLLARGLIDKRRIVTAGPVNSLVYLDDTAVYCLTQKGRLWLRVHPSSSSTD